MIRGIRRILRMGVRLALINVGVVWVVMSSV